VDAVFIALHGRFGEDGSLQRILEERGVPYIGSDPAASATAFDKILAKEAFMGCGVPTPDYVVYEGNADVLADVKLPVVVKPSRQGSSVGVAYVRERARLEAACREALKFDDRVLVEQCVTGRELTVGIFDGAVLPVIELEYKSAFFTYEEKYTPGKAKHIVPAALPGYLTARAQELARRAHTCLGCRDFSRVDIMMDAHDEMFVLEVNTIPGFTDTSLVPDAARAAGLSFQEICVRLVNMALARGPVAAAV
jgi:D-alanine-D-alanine ligase